MSHIWAEQEAKWAERDRRREAYEAELTAQEARHRAEHASTVYEALKARWPSRADLGELYDYAEVAVDALIASGVVFARIGMRSGIVVLAGGGVPRSTAPSGLRHPFVR